jgi:hypothetical protein
MLVALYVPGRAAISLTPLTASAEAWKLMEFQVAGVPAVSNPFDDSVVKVDATIQMDMTAQDPEGRTVVVPGFWYQNYLRWLANGSEVLTASGAPEWRVRFTPPAAGNFTITVSVQTNGQPVGTSSRLGFTVAPAGAGAPGLVQVATNRQYFCLQDGRALPLVGECVCWHGPRGTYDYGDWFPAMAAGGENYTRLWMAPWAFGLEAEPGTLTNYRLDRAWQLDRVFQLAETHGIYLMLCLDYHGMFEVEPDYWGGNNLWPQNPYNATLGGPCTNQDQFFANPDAKRTYQKRLRYLVGRYGASPRLLAWEFFNEIDNVYRYLQPTNVAAWHREMGDWMHAHDPFRHLVTTSMTGGSDRADIWSLPQMDFAMFHSYNQPNPAQGLSAISQSFLIRYGKPVMIGEYGVNWQGWNPPVDDPYLRGFRQGVWAGVFAGSVGTSMAWYWESIHAANLYPLYRSVADFVGNTHLGRGAWQAVAFKQSGFPPATVGALADHAAPFDARLQLDTGWGSMTRGTMALPDALAALESSGLLNSFVHGTGHPELRTPFRLSLWLDTNASLTLHVNSVSDGAIVNVRVDGATVFTKSLPNLDGTYQVNNEYDTNLLVFLPAGNHLVDVRNAGGDWYCLDWVKVSNALSAEYQGGWTPEPVATGIRGDGETLVYVANPLLKYPAQLTNAVLPAVKNTSLTVSNWAAGTFHALWYQATNLTPLPQTISTTTNGMLILPLPEFSEDIVGRLIRDFSLRAERGPTPRDVDVVVVGEAGPGYRLESSSDFSAWFPEESPTNAVSNGRWRFPADHTRRYFRGYVP